MKATGGLIPDTASLVSSCVAHPEPQNKATGKELAQRACRVTGRDRLPAERHGDATRDDEAWGRYLGSSEAIALDPAEQTVSHLRTWIAERWDVTVKSVDAAWDDLDGRRLNNRETFAWYDADTVYVPTTRLREAAGNVLTEREVAQALDQRGLLTRRHDERRIALRRVPNVGRIDAYALRRDQFGRPALGAGPDLRVHEGGLR
jgi:hypothetical protein